MRQDLRFPAKLISCLSLGLQVLLYRHADIEAQVICKINPAHSALAQEVDDPVAPGQNASGGEGLTTLFHVRYPQAPLLFLACEECQDQSS